MKFLDSERKKNNIKSTILREVFEDNLIIAGKAVKINNKKKRPKNKFVTISSASLTAILIYIFLNNFVLFKPTPTRNMGFTSFNSGIINPNSVLEVDGMEKSNKTHSQYNTFLHETQMTLLRIFGLKVKKILIDPGHGGEEAGAIGKLGIKEKDITLDISKKLRKRLRKHKRYQIMMTREEDITLSLEDRVEIANFSLADLFISIHINYIPNNPINLIETYYFGPPTHKDSLRIAKEENKSTECTVNDFKEIIQNIENTIKRQESNSLAIFIQKSLYRNISKQNKNIKDWGIKTAPFIVLLGVEIPCVLIEVTCLSNIEEEKKLNQDYYREEIARYLEEGIVSYLNKNIDKGEVTWSKKSL